ncbi:molybdenum cofactor guanylyltransferase MobA [Pasteurella canis]|uniref:Molybdenum cofactor guanylyltransferase n=1 Tax=Pasteurella canis TaxID=753 RepID=A0ABQ4VIU7_9PAST|nr:molybdenum cofactor guanylyltransferase MobA [Pasteurella canis]UEA16319.1 molybdenum cofactor guanylyltransferase MobA [Pasteurella canis]GJH43294.1 molybdenum cofactor guanylyltransferase [Pasteurella canis]
MTITISAVILAGGQARRMGGVDKGLQLFQQQPLFQHVYQRLQPQIKEISINANRNQDSYAQSGLSVFPDHLEGFQGPLSGILTSLQRAKTDFVLFVPCDCPFFPNNLLDKLKSAVWFSDVLIAYAQDSEREHPTFCLISTQLKHALADYLASGERKMLKFMQQHHAVAVDFSEYKNAFLNMNTLADLKSN